MSSTSTCSPLRERTQDLPALILAFARRHQEVFPGIISVDPQLTHYLSSQRFDGNIRELEHCVQRTLFAKTEGVSVELRDWIAQCPDNRHEAGGDLVCEAAQALWKAVSQRGLPYAQVLRLAGEASSRACHVRQPANATATCLTVAAPANALFITNSDRTT